MAMTKEQHDFIANLRKTREKKPMPDNQKKMRHITSINAPGILHTTIEGKCLMELSSGTMAWYDEHDIALMAP